MNQAVRVPADVSASDPLIDETRARFIWGIAAVEPKSEIDRIVRSTGFIRAAARMKRRRRPRNPS